MEYFGLKLGQDLENRAAHPYQKFRGVPPPPGKSAAIQCKSQQRAVSVLTLFQRGINECKIHTMHCFCLLYFEGKYFHRLCANCKMRAVVYSLCNVVFVFQPAVTARIIFLKCTKTHKSDRARQQDSSINDAFAIACCKVSCGNNTFTKPKSLYHELKTSRIMH